MLYIIYVIAGLGAGIVTGLAGLSAAVVITPFLVSIFGWSGYDAVTVALASDVLASLLSAYTYYKNKNIDEQRGWLVTLTAFIGTVIGSYCGYLFNQAQPDGLGYNLKVAVGTSTMIMSIVALTGAVSHVSMGAEIYPLPMAVVMSSCLVGAVISAKFANRCEIKKLNRIVGIVLLILGVVTIAIKSI